MSNKKALEIVSNNETKYTVTYESGDLKAINEINRDILEQFAKINMIPKNKANNLKNNILTFSLGNSKIGADTICINVSTGLNCPMRLLKNCDNCKICYAVAQNKQYTRNTVAKNLINQTIINKLVMGEIKESAVITATVESILKELTKKQIAELKFLRLNVEGDFLDNRILETVNNIVYFIVKRFNLISCYSYTHNRELDLKIATHINFNCSDFNSEVTNSCRTIFKITGELRSKIINRDVILCNGDCNNCSYCKNDLESRDIYFLAHGGKYKGIKELETTDKELLNIINSYKELDYKEFLKNYSSRGVTAE